MAISKHKPRTAYDLEATTGTVTTDWPNDGQLIHTAGRVDVSGIEQSLLDDERTTPRHNEMAGQLIKGLRNTTVEIPVYLTGNGSVTADTNQVTSIPLGVMIEHCLGARTRGNATFCKVGGTHTATQVELNATTNIAVGQVIGVVDADDSDSIVYPRRITDLTGDVATLDEALPFTPADNDKVTPAIMLYPDPDVLEDSSDSANQTMSWYLELGNSSAANVQIVGSKAALKLDGFERDGLPRCILNVNGSYFSNEGDSLSDVTWTGSEAGGAPVAMGRSTKFWLQDYGTTTQTAALHPSSLTIDPGVEVSPIEAVTEQTSFLEGLAGWSSPPARPSFEFTLVPHSSGYDTDLQAGTYKAVRVARVASEGNGWCIGMPRAEVRATPKLGENGDVLATTVSLLGHEDTSSIGSTFMARCPFYIALM